ncbi:DsbA family protein [Caballeronia sp. S22]|uniref:DsbA family protein n=1 Tax=Caballeronia sp. S22 TaxID=3137182 RepID=UPI003530E7D5
MESPVLHYIYDPFCGWCYGAAPMMSFAQEIPDLKIRPHGVGLLSGEKVQMISPQWVEFVRPHELRIRALSKQEFGDAYVHGVQEHQSVLLDSSPPIAAMLAADEIDGRGIAMLKKLQYAYYQDGRAIADRVIIGDIAEELGYERGAFLNRLETILTDEVAKHIAQSNDMLKALNMRGFPAFTLEINGELHNMPMGRYFARPALFKKEIQEMIESQRA